MNSYKKVVLSVECSKLNKLYTISIQQFDDTHHYYTTLLYTSLLKLSSAIIVIEGQTVQIILQFELQFSQNSNDFFTNSRIFQQRTSFQVQKDFLRRSHYNSRLKLHLAVDLSEVRFNLNDRIEFKGPYIRIQC